MRIGKAAGGGTSLIAIISAISADRRVVTGKVPVGASAELWNGNTKVGPAMVDASGVATYTFAFAVPMAAEFEFRWSMLASGRSGVLKVDGPLAGIIGKPEGFDGRVPFKVNREIDGSITHDFDVVKAKPAYTGTIYVGPGGTDTNDGSTYALRVRSLKQAIVKANARGAATRLLVDPAVYRFSDVVNSIQASFGAQRPTVDLVIEPASAGKIVSLADVVMPAFVATSDPQVFVSTYTTESVGQAVIDLSSLNQKGRPKALRRAWPSSTVEATVAAALQARHAQHGRGAFYLDTAFKKLYVRTLDGRAPDANLVVMASQNYNFELYAPAASLKLWMDNVECWGGNNPFRVTSGVNGTPTVWSRNSGFCYAGAGHGYAHVAGGGVSFVVNGCADDNGADGFDYNGITSLSASAGSVNGMSPMFYELGCTADYNGWAIDGDGSYNGSTSHAGCRGVRINCSYSGTANRPIHDIQGAQTWNLGITVGQNMPVTGQPTVTGPYASVCSGYPGLGYPSTSKIWLDACTLSNDNTIDAYAYEGGQVFYANMRSTRMTTAISGVGSAVTPYTSRQGDQPVIPAMMPLPALPLAAGARFPFHGDSQMQFSHQISNGIVAGGGSDLGTSSLAVGLVAQAHMLDPRIDISTWYDPADPWFNAKAGSARQFEGANQGIAADHLVVADPTGSINGGGIVPRLDYTLAKPTEIVFFEGATNTIATGDTLGSGTGAQAAYVIAKLDEAFTKIRAAGRWCITTTIWPRSDFTGAREQVRLDVNAWIRTQTGRDGIVGIIDAEAVLAPNGVQDLTMFTPDPGNLYVHLSQKGAYILARDYLNPIIAQAVAPGSVFNQDPSVSNLYAATAWQLPGNTGTRAGGSGSVATGCALRRTRGAGAYTATKETISTNNFKQVFSFTSSGSDTGVNGFDFTLPPLNAASVQGGVMPSAGQWITAHVFYEITAAAEAVSLDFAVVKVTDSAAAADRAAARALFGSFAGLGLLPGAGPTRSGWLSTPPLQIPVGASFDTINMIVSTFIDGRIATTVNPTIKISKPIVRVVPDPRLAWRTYTGPAIGTYAANDAGYVKAFYDWLGITPPGSFGDAHVARGDYNPAGTFQGELDDWTSADWPLTQSGWIGKGRVMHAAVPMFPKSGNFVDALAGKYDASVLTIARKIANALDLTQDEFWVRLGWEFNGGFQPWMIVKNGVVDPVLAANYVAWWKRMRALFLSVSAKFRFNWCVNLGDYDFRAAYPGDDQVDIIGMDAYPGIGDATYAYPNVVSGPAQLTLWNTTRTRAFGLDDIANFAELHGKLLCIPEFAIQFDNGQVFMDNFWAWLLARKVAYVGWWNANAGGVASLLSSGAIPNTGACVRFRWNPAAYKTQPSTPAYVPTNRANSDLTKWTKSGGVATLVSGQSSPSGKPVYALRPTDSTTNTIHRIYLNMSVPNGQPVKVRIEVKADGENFMLVNGAKGPDSGMICADVVNGTITAGNMLGEAKISPISGATGWFLYEFDAVLRSGGIYPYIHINRTSGGEQSFVGDAGKGLLLGAVEWLV